jgi:predicted amidophosphoribosyltransferase
LIDRVAYAAGYAYSPRGNSEVSQRSRQLRDLVKGANPQTLPQIAARVSQWAAAREFPGFFGPQTTLVPVPARAPRRDPDALWVPERICLALHAAGLGREVWPALQRTVAVPKSAFAARGERPELQVHMESLAVTSHVPPTPRILLVDDFVTKGRTLLAAAKVLDAAMPALEIRAFAVVRTMGLVPDVEQIRWPVVGEIRLEDGDAVREP